MHGRLTQQFDQYIGERMLWQARVRSMLYFYVKNSNLSKAKMMLRKPDEVSSHSLYFKPCWYINLHSDPSVKPKMGVWHFHNVILLFLNRSIFTLFRTSSASCDGRQYKNRTSLRKDGSAKNGLGLVTQEKKKLAAKKRRSPASGPEKNSCILWSISHNMNMNPVNNLAFHVSPSSYLVTAPDRFPEGHEFDSKIALLASSARKKDKIIFKRKWGKKAY